MGKKHFCFFQTAETRNRARNSGVKGSGANHYPRAPAQQTKIYNILYIVHILSLIYTHILPIHQRHALGLNFLSHANRVGAEVLSSPCLAVRLCVCASVFRFRTISLKPLAGLLSYCIHTSLRPLT